MKIFTEFLKKVKLSNNLTQPQFTACFNIDSIALNKIENGIEIDPSKLELLSSEFKLDLDELKSSFFSENIVLGLYSYKHPITIFRVT